MCTLITINAKDGSVLTGRTQEFTAHYKAKLIFRPRNSELPRSFFGESKFKFKNKYSFIHQCAEGMMPNEYLVADGMNEKGLSVSFLYFHYFKYKELSNEELTQENLHYLSLGSYLLSNISSVQELREKNSEIEKILYWEKGKPQAGMGFHLSIIDSTGDSVVLEPENEKLVLKENPLRVLTNSSPLEYHYENLRKMSHLTPNEKNPTILYKGLKNHKLLTQGNGLWGIPGDFTADSRFVRAAVFSSLVDEVVDAEEGATILFRMLHTADLVPGYVTDELTEEQIKRVKNVFPSTLEMRTKKNTITDHTDSILVKDLKNLKYYYKTYNNITPRVIDLKSMVNNKKTSRILMENDGSSKFTKIELK